MEKEAEEVGAVPTEDKSIIGLIDFLSSQMLKLRRTAINTLRFISSSKHRADLLPVLRKRENLVKLCNKISEFPAESITILVNVSDDEQIAKPLATEFGFLPILVALCDGRQGKGQNNSQSTESETSLQELGLMMLSNLTGFPFATSPLLKVPKPSQNPQKESWFHDIINKGLSNDPQVSNKALKNWCPPILANISQTEEGRKFMIDNKLFAKIIPILSDSAASKQSRLGAIRTLKNCLFANAAHKEALLPPNNLLTALLLPLIHSPQLSDEEKQGMDPVILKKIEATPNTSADDIEAESCILDCLLLLTSTKSSRVFMRSRKAYPLLREYQKRRAAAEEGKGLSEEAMEVAFKVIETLLRPEEGEENNNGNESSNNNNNNNNNENSASDADEAKKTTT